MLASFFACASVALTASQRHSIHLEAEAGQLRDTTIATLQKGYSGAGYVTGFVKPDAAVTFTCQTIGGIYEIRIGYATPSGPKGYAVKINGSEISGMLPFSGERFGVVNAGKVELTAGRNVIEVERGWGYFDLDYVELIPAVVSHALRRPAARLVDNKATPEARELLGRLIGSYGQSTLSGQYGADDSNYIARETGRTPAIFGDDFMDFSPSRIEHNPAPRDLTERAIARSRAGQIVTMSWHWNAPTDLLNKKYKDSNGNEVDASWYKGFYTNASTFDLAKALDDPNSERYRLLLRDIDAISVQLKKFSDARVPILWRPLHEAEGGWFWWGAKGPGPFVKLWRLMYDRLTRVHGIHNLIWVFTVGADPNWYPGDAYVDVLGVDAYPGDHSDPLSSTWESLKDKFDGKKLLAISEFGGVPDVSRMRRFGVEWAYFVSWNGTVRPPGTPVEALTRIYRDASVSNR
ncbi:MAG: glycosyl hydrolase [Fimbriimonas sp.]|nr:glycosyl hydrolase [Fimbriimonas sp.]